MKSTPDEARFVCESVTIPPVRLQDASQRVLNPAPEEPLLGWRRIHADIEKFRKH